NRARILHFFLNLVRHFLGHNLQVAIGRFVWIQQDTELASSLNGIGFTDFWMRLSNVLHLGETLDVLFAILAASTRAGTGNGVGNVDNYRLSRAKWLVFVVLSHTVDHFLGQMM